MRVSCLEKGKFPDVFVSYLATPCYHCEAPSCMEVCPVDAISKRTDGIVVVDREACLGESACGAPCREACPYGAPQFGEEEEAKMQKCDFCVERWEQDKKPVCVEACPMRALDAGPLDEMRAKYGDVSEASGFVYSSDVRPSVTFKPKTPKVREAQE
jgi:anaerobic dimethyl sulfoxide reductase subunit B (iron-sulfur subunit)